MTKTTGLGDNLFVGGYDLSGDTGSFDRIGGGPAALDLTDITQSAFDREGGKRDGEISWSTWLNPSAGRAHPRLSLLPTTATLVTYLNNAGTIGNAACSCWARQINYDPNRGEDGSLPISVQALSDGYGIEWGDALTPGKRTDTTATNGASLDTAASASFGAQAYCQVFSVVGTSCTVAVQDSADDSSFANVTGLVFTTVNAGSVGFERLATANTATVRRYLRVATTGTFSSAVLAVQITKNATAGQVF
jgi:hypothetical protein